MKRWLKRLSLGFLVLVAGTGIYYIASYNISWNNFGVVEDGKIYRCGQLNEKSLKEITNKYKIKTIVSLRGGPPQMEKDFAAANGIQVFAFRMSARTEPKDEDIEKALEIISNPINQPVLVHCRGGADRTGLILALHRVLHQGWNLSDAEAEMSYYRNLPFFTPMPRQKLRQYVLEKAVIDHKLLNATGTNGGFRAAADKEIITPKGQPTLAGFSPKRLSLGVHDDLSARCLVIECPTGEKLAIVSLDLVGFIRYDVLQVRKEIRERGILNPDFLIICSTHQHSGPDPIGIWGRFFAVPPNISGSGRDETYLAGVREKIVSLVKRTIAKLEPAKLEIIEASGEGYSKNIRLEKEIDQSLMTLKITGDNGTIATLVNFGVHPESYRQDNQLITADFPGQLVQKLEKEWGGTAIFVNGLLGAMVSVRTGNLGIENPTAEQRAEGTAVGLTKRITDADPKKTELNFSNGYLRIRKKLIKIPLDNFYFQEGMKLGVIPYSSDTVTENQEVIVEIGIVDLGDLRILLVPGEMQPKIGLRIKELTGAKMIFGLANDEIGYIIPTEDFYKKVTHPKKGEVDVYRYERTMSLSPKLGQLIYEAFRELTSRD
ncbi:MAG: Neutral/alkaline non-lysosomal ceramidase [Parcubacteria group bacterium Gr01-1014_19]|nr:MAG: Neutral/alkaline non-lysosomal ceramidase [Parcubacteria group bacterium Gr01-1014_19]